MSPIHLLILCGATFLVSMLGVVTGGHSMITVPLMMFFGLPPAVAVATNRFANIFLAASGSTTYYRKGKLNLRFTWPYVIASLPGAALGALLVMNVSGHIIRMIIGVFMVVMVGLTFFLRDTGLVERTDFDFSSLRKATGLLLAFLVGAYWGFFGGGGMTLFTLMLTLSFGLSFLQSVGTSNVAMLLSSVIAVSVFFAAGSIDLVVGLAMAASMATGAWIGATLAIKVGNLWIKRVFTLMIIFFAIKLITGWPTF